MFRSSGSDRYESKSNANKVCCCIQEYEQQISMLQDKLMQTHNKLIQQLDVCRQQELTIIDLTKKMMNLEQNSMAALEESQSFASSSNMADVSKVSQQFQRACFYANKNCQFTLNNSNNLPMSNYNSPTFVQNNRNQLLKTDLQAMRHRLLQQITQKSSLHEQLNQLKQVHSQKMSQYKKKMSDLQNDHEYLLKQYQYIKISLQKGGKGKQQGYESLNLQINQLTQRSDQFERLYKRQVVLNQEMKSKISDLKALVLAHKEKVKTLEAEIQKYNHSLKSTSTAADGLKDQRDRNREDLCGTIRMSKNPGTLWEKDSIKNKVNPNLTDTQIFKKRNTIIESTFTKQRVPTQIAKQEKQIMGQAISKLQQNDKKASKRSQYINKQNKQDYESTKQLIRKLEEAEKQTRQRKKNLI